MMTPHEIINTTYLNCLKQAEDKIRELYDTELTENDKELISLEEYAGFYALDFELNDYDESIIMTGETPKVNMILRKKTPEEIIETMRKRNKYNILIGKIKLALNV